MIRASFLFYRYNSNSHSAGVVACARRGLVRHIANKPPHCGHRSRLTYALTHLTSARTAGVRCAMNCLVRPSTPTNYINTHTKTGVAACARRTVDSPNRGLSSRRSKPPTCVTCGYLPPLNSCIFRTAPQKRRGKYLAFFMVHSTGVAPLAARHGEQRLSAVQFAYVIRKIISFCANRSLPFAPPPSTPVDITRFIPTKRGKVISLPLFVGALNRS